MKTSTAMTLFIIGLVVTGFGLGGVENSIEDLELLASLAVSAVGLAIMYAGSCAMQVADYYDAR
jgi:hypothetical protein